MTYPAFVENLGKARLNISQFASLVCTNKNSFTNCASTNHVADHWAIVVTLMAEMASHNIDFRRSLASLSLAPKKPRGGAAKGRFGGNRQEVLPFDPEAETEGLT